MACIHWHDVNTLHARTVDLVVINFQEGGAHEEFEVGARARRNVLENVLKRVGHDAAQLLVCGDALWLVESMQVRQ